MVLMFESKAKLIECQDRMKKSSKDLAKGDG